MVHAGEVELESGPEYFVELQLPLPGATAATSGRRWRTRSRTSTCTGWTCGSPAPGTTRSSPTPPPPYLGAGWLLLDAYREESVARDGRMVRTASKLGYLTPEEFGYVVAKRALVFGDDVEPWFSGAQARDAYRAGLALAREDLRRPPLAAAGWTSRRGYAKDRRHVRELHRRTGRPVPAVRTDDYAFEGGSPLRVSFPCPTCRQRMRLPVRGKLTARCTLCRTELDCDT